MLWLTNHIYTSNQRKCMKWPGVSCIKLSVDFILKVYVGTKARFCVHTNVFRLIKACVRRNLRKNHFINPSQGKVVRTCISTPSPPRNHYIWSLQRLVLLCITSSAYHFNAELHPHETMFNTVKGIFAKSNPLSLLYFIINISTYSLKTKLFKIVIK